MPITFLPYKSYRESAKVLDNKRLNYQRKASFEILQIIVFDKKSLVLPTNSLKLAVEAHRKFAKHPVVKLWYNSELQLTSYAIEICKEWIRRKKDDHFLNTFQFLQKTFKDHYYSDKIPSIIGNELFHSSHRAALLAKDYVYYKRFGWTEIPKIKYIWKEPEETLFLFN